MSKTAPKKADIELGGRIRLRRHQLGWSQKQLSCMISVTFQQVQKYENGTNRVSYSRLTEIAAALSCSVQDLTGDETTGTDPLQEYAGLLVTHGAVDLVKNYNQLTKPARRSLLELSFNLSCDEISASKAVQHEPVEKINSDVIACETCGVSGDIETMTMMGDVWMCEKCVAASRKEFDACDHDWHPDEFNGEPEKYCGKCNWFIPATIDTPSPASTETFSDEELIAFLEKSAVDAGPGVAAKLRATARRLREMNEAVDPQDVADIIYQECAIDDSNYDNATIADAIPAAVAIIKHLGRKAGA